MKSLVEYIEESSKISSLDEYINESGYRYLAMYTKKDTGWERVPLNNLRDFEPDSDMTYWETVNMTNSDLSDIDALINWHGEGGYWSNVYNNSINPEKAPKDAKILKGRDLELLKKKRK